MKFKNMIMGLALGSVLGLAVVDTVGCKTIEWTPELVYKTTYCIGCTAGAVVDAQKYPAEVTDEILDCMDLAIASVPKEGQTLQEVWLPIVDKFLAESSKLPEEYKPLVRKGFEVLTLAYDIEKAKHPEMAQGEEYVRKGLSGLADGFKFFVKRSSSRFFKNKKTPYVAPEINYDLYREVASKCFNK